MVCLLIWEVNSVFHQWYQVFDGISKCIICNNDAVYDTFPRGELSRKQNGHSAVCALQTKLLTDTQYSCLWSTDQTPDRYPIQLSVLYRPNSWQIPNTAVSALHTKLLTDTQYSCLCSTDQTPDRYPIQLSVLYTPNSWHTQYSWLCSTDQTPDRYPIQVWIFIYYA
jgi:hypothetical protein